MAIKREFLCPEHGIFESKFPMCPHGCVDVERIHTAAPMTVSRRTRNIDATLNGMAKDYKLSDISNKNGSLANSVDQFKPKPVPMDPAFQAYIQRHASRFGQFEIAADGSIWRNNSNLPESKAKLNGHLDQISGVPNQSSSIRPIVQASFADTGVVAQAKTQYKETNNG